jgi:SAM-dependent methyltransferase
MAGEIVNVDMAAAWDGDEGDDWVREWERYDHSMRPFHDALLAAVPIERTDRVLDIGCGNGESTRDTARLAPDGSAFGIDLSSRMIERARELARLQGVRNVVFEHGDVQAYPFADGAHDVCISRFGAMFFSDTDAAFSNFGRSIRHGGRLGLVFWRRPDQNEWFQCVFGALAVGRELPSPVPGVPGPFALADVDSTRGALERAGFDSIEVEPVDRPFWIGTDVEDAFGFFRASGIARGLMQDLDDAQRARAFDALRATMAEHASADGVAFGASAWLATARRYRR